MDRVAHTTMTTRDEALARVLEYRERGRRRPALARLLLAVVGGALFIAAIPVGIVLPELGVPALLVALRLLAVEADWVARAYAWINWRFAQARAWFRRQSPRTRSVLVSGLTVVAIALVWFLVEGFL